MRPVFKGILYVDRTINGEEMVTNTNILLSFEGILNYVFASKGVL